MPVQFPFDAEKFLAVVQYVAEKNVPELDKYKICKLVFLADKYHLVRYGRPIIGGRYCALPYGPVPSQALDLLNAFIEANDLSSADPQVREMADKLEVDRRFRDPRFSAKAGPAFRLLSKSDLMALDHIIESYGKRSFNELLSLTHSMYAYRTIWQQNPNGEMRYEDFFEEDPDAIAGASEEMVENDEISKVFPESADI